MYNIHVVNRDKDIKMLLHYDSTDALLLLEHCNAGVFIGMSKAQFCNYTLRSTQINKLI